MSQAVALCLCVARPYFGPFWRSLSHNTRHLARRTAGALRLLPPLSFRGDFRLGLEVTVISVRRHTASVPPVLLLTPEPISPPPGIDAVVRFDPRPFEAAARCHSSLGGLSAYFKISLFGLEGWDRIVYLDTDTLALGDISELWDLARFTDKAFYAVRETAEMGPGPAALGKFNTGVMVINAAMFDRKVHERLIKLLREGKSYDCGDQGAINAFLASEATRFPAGELPEEYNVFVNHRIGTRWPRLKGRAKILHFVGDLKPWNPDYERNYPAGREFKRLWDDAARNRLSNCNG